MIQVTAQLLKKIITLKLLYLQYYNLDRTLSLSLSLSSYCFIDLYIVSEVVTIVDCASSYIISMVVRK